MSNAPDKIYLHQESADHFDDALWSQDRISADDVEYVRAPASAPLGAGEALLNRFQAYIQQAYEADGELQGIYNEAAEALGSRSINENWATIEALNGTSLIDLMLQAAREQGFADRISGHMLQTFAMAIRKHFAHAALSSVPVDPAPKGPALLCAHCEKNPATCVGRSEGHGGFTPACDECCGHGNEDGFCTAPTDLAGILREASEVIFGLEEEVADLRQAAPSPGAGA